MGPGTKAQAAIAPMVFTAPIEKRGINPFILVSAERAGMIQAGWKRPMPVQVQIDGAPDPAWRINMMPAGDGGFYLYLDGRVRQEARAQVGAVVTVSIVFDQDYRGGPQHQMPQDFADGLSQDAVAQARWTSLSPSLQKEVLRYLANLKSEQARDRNIEKALRVLAGSKERFLARDWN